MTLRHFAAGITAIALAASACGSETPTTPSESAATPTTQTFSSSVQRNGATSRSFTTDEQGAITVTLTSLGVDGLSMGLGLGLSDSATGQCLLTYSVVTSTYAGRAISVKADAGQYCVVVYDVGEVSNVTSFEVTVTHF